MTRAEMERELAEQTGESLATLRRHGFQYVETPAPRPRMVDWDAVDRRRVRYLPQRANRREKLAA